MDFEDDLNAGKPVELPPAMTDDELLDLTQRTRMAMIQGICQNGVPTDSKTARVLNEIINGAESTVLGKKRLDNETDRSKADQLAAEAAIQLISKFGNNNPFERAVNETDITTNDFTLPADKVKDAVVVEGELDIGVSDMSYDEFMAKREAED